MARKDQSSSASPVDYFTSTVAKYDPTAYAYANRVICAQTKSGTIFIKTDDELWNQVMDDEDWKMRLEEFKIQSDPSKEVQSLFALMDTEEDVEWFPIPAEDIFNGTLVTIHIDAYDYDIPVSKTLYPKMKKAEYTDFYYHVYLDPYPVLMLKKRWTNGDNHIDVMRPFRIL